MKKSTWYMLGIIVIVAIVVLISAWTSSRNAGTIKNGLPVHMQEISLT